MSVTIPQTPEEFAALTWEQIEELACDAVDDPESYMFMVGAGQDYQKEYTYSGNTYHARVVGIAHHDLADGSGKSGFSFEAVECVPPKVSINDTPEAPPWPDTSLHDTLHAEGESGFPNLDPELAPFIEKVQVVYFDRQPDAPDSLLVATVDDYLYISSYREIFGRVWYYGDEGEQLEWYAHNTEVTNEAQTARIKICVGSDKGARYWTRTPVSDAEYLCITSTGLRGAWSVAGTADSTYALAFCIGRHKEPEPEPSGPRAVSVAQFIRMLNAGISLGFDE